MWFHALFGFLFSLIPVALAGRFVHKYAMYLAKLGRNQFQVAVIALGLLTLLSFSFAVIFCLIYIAIFNPEYRPWMHRSGILGAAAWMGVVWLWQCMRLARYQASYFIEYIYPRQSVIVGVPLAIVSFALLVFVKSGLAQFTAGYAATRFHQPAFCRFVRDHDACQEQFYDPEVVAGGKVDPKICRALSGQHVIQCLVRYHSNHPDASSCKILRETEGEDSPAYYWCLGYLPKTREIQEACRRAESSFHWTNVFFAQCINEQNINQKIESGKTALMQFLVFKESTRNATTIGKTGIKYRLPIQTDLADLLSLNPELDKSDKDGRTVLFYVHDLKDLEALIKKGPRVNHQDTNGLTAPMYWMSRKNPETYGPHIALLVKHGYEINLGDKKSRPLITYFLTALKEEDPGNRNSPENLAFIKQLLKLGANPFLRDKVKKRPIDIAKDLGMDDDALDAMRKFRKYQSGEADK